MVDASWVSMNELRLATTSLSNTCRMLKHAFLFAVLYELIRELVSPPASTRVCSCGTLSHGLEVRVTQADSNSAPRRAIPSHLMLTWVVYETSAVASSRAKPPNALPRLVDTSLKRTARARRPFRGWFVSNAHDATCIIRIVIDAAKRP